MSQFPVESLIAGRARRSTAGNRLASLLHQEADKDDTLFMEDESDVEYAGDEEEPEDIDLGSSSSEDEGPPKEGDVEELEGEKELLREQREAKKIERRKAQEAFMKPKAAPKVKKKVTIVEQEEEGDSTGGDYMNETLGGRPRKKSERISWVPTDMAVRSSSRTLSVANKERTHKRLEESEKRRLQIIAHMDAAKEKNDTKSKKKEMTQAERLAEAAVTERKNRKSLNRWEESEMQRVEAQRARLAALHQRRLDGPIIRTWSGKAEYDHMGNLKKLGKLSLEDLEGDTITTKPKRKRKDMEGEDEKMEDATPTDGAPAIQVIPQEAVPEPPKPVYPPVYATKNVVILDNFEPAPHTREQTSRILFGKNNTHYGRRDSKTHTLFPHMPC